MLEAFAHCGYCGHKYDQADWPRVCQACRSTQWRNPTPVSVLMVPVWDAQYSAQVTPGTRRGILVGKRGHEPGYGKWGLPGGFVELNEYFERGAVREMFEETGIEINPDFVKLWYSRNNSNGQQVLVFNEFKGTLPLQALDSFMPCAECPEVKVCWEPEELAFATHTEALRLWFEKEV